MKADNTQSKPTLPPRLKGKAILRPKWVWLDQLPDDDPILKSVKEKNSDPHTRTALLLWEDGSFATYKCLSWPIVPMGDVSVLPVGYKIGRAWLERTFAQEGGE